jgi:predicted TIM-barrel fold metal-dependent hydrolase
MIIDCHTHIFEAGRGGPFNLPSSADDLVREMDAHGVDISIVLPLPGVATNEFAHTECGRHKGRLRALYTPEFGAPDVIGRMESFFERWAPCGLKIHPRQQGINVEQPAVREVLAWAAGRDVPVLFDVFPFGPSLGDTATYPLAYHAVARDLPALRMVLAHAGGIRLMDAFLVAKSDPGVYLDLSFTPVYFKGSSLAEDCSFVCRRLPAGRVLYGSDFPYVPFADSLEAAARISSALESDSQREFMGEAAARFFGLAKA